MSTWTSEELERWDGKICEFGKTYGLDWHPIDYEIIDYKEMIGAMAYSGLPTHYRHWSFGKQFEQTHTRYNLGMEGLPYEMIINSNPSIAYLMAENPMSTHLLTMAHCVGHSDFFKNNRMFKHTDPDNVLVRFKSAAKRVASYMDDPSIGVDRVERVLDACHSIKYQTYRTPGIQRNSDKELIEKYTILRDKSKSGENIDISKLPLEPEYNLLKFIRMHSRNLEEWEKDVMSIVEYESHYFVPQAYTKIMNEGWACFIHEKIIKDLDLPQEYHIAFIKLHNQVVRPHVGSVNPYHLGFKLFKKIEEMHGFEYCKMVREVHDDIGFLRSYLDEDMCRELNLFNYSLKPKEERHTIDDISDNEGWKIVRDNLLTTVGLNSIPIIRVEQIEKDYTLHLLHEHDGRDLEISYANKVLGYIVDLWGDEVKMTTILEEEPWEF
jgi:stage V sporulation protein R